MPAAGRARVVVPVVIVAAALALAGGFVGRQVYRADAAEPAPSTTTAPPSSVRPSAPPPGPDSVRLTRGAAEYPYHRQVRELLERYFHGINSKNYTYWRGSVTDAIAAKKPRQVWLDAFRTTRDGSIVVHRIEPGAGPDLRVLLSFTSTQDRSDAPADFRRGCIRWRVVFPLTRQHGGWRVATGPAGTAPRHSAC